MVALSPILDVIYIGDTLNCSDDTSFWNVYIYKGFSVLFILLYIFWHVCLNSLNSSLVLSSLPFWNDDVDDDWCE